MLPLGAFGWIAYEQVTAQLEEESRRTLHASAKSAGMLLASRLATLCGRLDFVSSMVRRGSEGDRVLGERSTRETLLDRFRSLAVEENGTRLSILGDAVGTTDLDAKELAHLERGRWLVRVVRLRGSPVIEFVHTLGSSEDSSRRLLVATAGPEQVFDLEAMRGRDSDFALLDSDLQVVLTTGASPERNRLRTAMVTEPSSAIVDWEANSEPLVSRYWRVFLEPQYGHDWISVQTIRHDSALAALQYFRTTIFSVAALALLVVASLAIATVQGVIDPVRRLVAASRRVAAGDFTARTNAKGRDELAELGTAFDQMTGELAEHVRRRDRVARDLAAARDAALDAARAKAEFLSNVSHELRTPLTAIVSATDILEHFGEDDPEARQEFLGILREQSERLQQLIDGVLQLQGEHAMARQPVSLSSAIESAIEAMPPAVQTRVDFGDDSDEPLSVRGDRSRLQQLVRILLDNAAKFSPPESSIAVRLRRQEDHAVLEIVDLGRGIDASQLGRIFEPFHQGDQDILTDKASGLGLGLTLAQDVAARHGGRIEVHSQPGRGSTFRVLLPLCAERSTAAV